MGKIKTEGRVTLEFEPDLYEILIIVRTESKSSGEAVTAGKQQTEQLLQAFQDELGIKPEQISAESEEIENTTKGYGENSEELFRFSRKLCLHIPANNTLRERVTDLLAKMDNTSYRINALLSDEATQKSKVLEHAVQCAKKKADQMASSLNSKVIGFEEISTDGKTTKTEMYDNFSLSELDLFKAKKLSDLLNNPKITISGEVTVVWLTEPLS